MEVHDHIVDTIGSTPMVRLGRIHSDGNLVAKLEYLNPGGSSKDRIAVAMIERAERNGWLKPSGTIIEPTSGNTGVALAMAASLKGYKLIAVIGDKQSVDKVDLLRAYGADLHRPQPQTEQGKHGSEDHPHRHNAPRSAHSAHRRSSRRIVSVETQKIGAASTTFHNAGNRSCFHRSGRLMVP